MDGDDSTRSERGGVTDLVRSARGWHGVQLGVLAFIGLCGVLTESDPAHPRWLQVGAGVAALVALGLACVAVFLVAGVAWPLSATGTDADGTIVDTTATGRRRLRAGVALTYAAVVTMAVAASASWWPNKDRASADGESGAGVTVEITDHNGATACGQLLDAPAGTVRVATASGSVEVATSGLAAITPADSC